MISVLIMGVLATIGIASFRGELSSAKNTEALSVIRSISSAQEKYRAEHMMYQDISNNWFPDDAPATNLRSFWGSGHADEADWRELAPEVPQLIQFSYLTRSGLPRTTPAALQSFTNAPAWPATNTINEPWYFVQALGDLDDDGETTVLAVTSFNSRVFQENIGE